LQNRLHDDDDDDDDGDDDDDYDGKEEEKDDDEEKRNVKLRRQTDTALIFYLEELDCLSSRLFCELLYSETVH
jgi:hypothetical protein